MLHDYKLKKPMGFKFLFNNPNKQQRLLAITTAIGLNLCLSLMPSFLPGFFDASIAAQQLETNGDNASDKLTNNNKFALGTNLAGINDWSTQLPFLNAFKSARQWFTQCGYGDPQCSGSWDTQEYGKLDLDEYGWVKSLPAPQDSPEYTRVSTVMFTGLNGHYPGGDYVVLYDGEGTIEYNWAAQKDALKSTPGRDVLNVNPSNGGIYLSITSTDPNKTGNYIRNIRVVPAQYETTYQSQIFNPEFLGKTDKFTALRFMDWMKTNNSNQKEWADRPQVKDYTYAKSGGVPIEVMVALANQIKADPWFNIPHLATDKYTANFAKLVKETLDPNLNVYVEFSNEVWNWAFQQAQYANIAGRSRWGNVGDAYMQWYGMKTAQMCDTWKGVFGTEADRVKCVISTQTAWKGFENSVLNCRLWVAEGNKPCYQHGIDVYAISGYFSGNLGANKNNIVLESWIKEPKIDEFEKAFEQIRNGSLLAGSDSIKDTLDNFLYHQQVAQDKGLELTVYEGGQHITGNGYAAQENQLLTNFFIELNRRPEMYDIYTELLEGWKKSGGGLFMHYSDIVKPSKWGSWGALEYLDQDSSPKYDALMDFIGKNTIVPVPESKGYLPTEFTYSQPELLKTTEPSAELKLINSQPELLKTAKPSTELKLINSQPELLKNAEPSTNLRFSNYEQPALLKNAEPSTNLRFSNYEQPALLKNAEPTGELKWSNYYQPDLLKNAEPTGELKWSNYYQPELLKTAKPSTELKLINYYQPELLKTAEPSTNLRLSNSETEMLTAASPATNLRLSNSETEMVTAATPATNLRLSNSERERKKVSEPSSVLGLFALVALCGFSVAKGKKKI